MPGLQCEWSTSAYLYLRPETLSLLEAEGPQEPCDALYLGKEEAGSGLGWLAFSLCFQTATKEQAKAAADKGRGSGAGDPR